MKVIRIRKPKGWAPILTWVGGVMALAYLFCMFVYPWFAWNWDWGQVEGVWHHWQALNVGMLAFISSIIALNISANNANKQRHRTFVAARAFLPEALDELMAYLKKCVPLLEEAWRMIGKERQRTGLKATMPELPSSYKEVFSRCIESADAGVGEQLALILMRLQISHARVQQVYNYYQKADEMFAPSPMLLRYLFGLGELQALLARTFSFARGIGDLDRSELQESDYHDAYANLGILVDNFERLQEFTIEKIGSGGN